MRWVRWDKARHTLTVVDAGGSRAVLADLSPSLRVRFTPPVDGTPSGTFVYYADSTQAYYADNTALEYA